MLPQTAVHWLSSAEVGAYFRVEQLRAKVLNMGVSKTSDPIQIKIKMSHPSQEPPVSSKAPNEDLKDMDNLCTFKIKIEIKKSDHGFIKDQ